MIKDTQTLLSSLKLSDVLFIEVINFIEENYYYQPSAFKNGDVYNEASQNQGSAKVFSFAHLNNLSKEDTLCLFAEYYQAVLASPNGTNHQNIRQFILHGWEGIKFEGEVLSAK